MKTIVTSKIHQYSKTVFKYDIQDSNGSVITLSEEEFFDSIVFMLQHADWMTVRTIKQRIADVVDDRIAAHRIAEQEASDSRDRRVNSPA